MHADAASMFRDSVRAQHRTLVEGLIALKPKKRSLTVHWILAAALAFVVGSLGTDVSVREAMFSPRVAARAPQFAASVPRAPQPLVVAMPVFATAAVAAPSVVAAAPAPIAAAEFAPVTVEAPLPHAKARHTHPTTRAHSRQRHTK